MSHVVCAGVIKDRFYDALNTGLDRKGFAHRRERQVAELRGDVLEVGAGTGLNLPRCRLAARVVALEPDGTYLRRMRSRAAAAHVPAKACDPRSVGTPDRVGAAGFESSARR